MKAKELYRKLNKDFGIDDLKDDWSFMNFNDYIAPEFKKHYAGLVLDNTDEVNKVYTAAMPDLEILEQVIRMDETDILLFSHHAMGYDPALAGFPFYDIPEEYLLKLKQQRISFYMLHLPLDKNGEYSTSVNLAKHLNMEITDEFCEYGGIKCGVICKTDKRTATGFKEHVQSRIGHEVKLIMHGENKINKGLVAVAAGGGSVGFAVKELADFGVNMYITGTTRHVPGFEPVMEFHRIIKEKKINVVGATHYSTEKYACIAMVKYFEKFGIPAKFLEGRYYPEDL